MNATFYYNKSDKRYLNKDIEAKYRDIPIQILTPSSIINPTLKVSSGLIGQNVNYVYIPDLRRYYYIDNYIMENGFVIIECKVDVLMSFKNEILSEKVIASRSSNRYNLYLPDDKFKMYNYSRIQTFTMIPQDSLKFDMSIEQFVLTTAGSSAVIT